MSNSSQANSFHSALRLQDTIFVFAILFFTAHSKADLRLIEVPIGTTIPGTGVTATAPPTTVAGTGTLAATLTAAADLWNGMLNITDDIPMHFGWADLPNSRGAAAYVQGNSIVFDQTPTFSDGLPLTWFVDGTPYEPQEFFGPETLSTSAYSSDGSFINVQDEYTARSSSQASSNSDLFSIAVHELAHAIGFKASNWPAMQPINIPGTQQTLPVGNGQGLHLQIPTAAMWFQSGTNKRIFPSTADQLAVFAVTGYSSTSTTFPIVSSGDFYNRNTWSSGFPPTSTSQIQLSGGTAHTIAMQSDATSGVLNVVSGTINLDLNGQDYELFGSPQSTAALKISGGLTPVDGSRGKVAIDDGTLFTPDVLIDGNPRNEPDYPLLVIEQAASLVVSTDLFQVGNAQQGRVEQSGDVDAQTLSIGVQAGSFGEYEFDGIEGGNLDANQLYIGDAGTGEFIHHGGIVDVAVKTTLGLKASPGQGVGKYTFQFGDLYTPRLEIGLFGQGEFIQNGGDVSVGSTVRIGDKPNSHGDYYMQGGTLDVDSNDGSIYVGQEGDGNFEIDESSQSSSVSAISLVVGNNPGSFGNVNHFAGDIMLSGDALIGRFGQGQYDMRGGNLNVAGAFSVGQRHDAYGFFGQSGGNISIATGQIGQNVDAEGLYLISGGSLTSSTLLIVATRGDGELRLVSETAQVNAYDLSVGHQTEGNGLVAHSAGTVSIANDLIIAGYGNAVYELSGGAVDVAGEVMIARETGSTGSMLLFDGSLTAGSISFGDGIISHFEFFGGTLSVDTFNGDLQNLGGTLFVEGTDQVTGDYSASADSIVKVGISAEYDQALAQYVYSSDTLQVDGTATLDGWLMISVDFEMDPSLDYQNIPDFEVLTAAGGIVGNFIEPTPPLVSFVDENADEYYSIIPVYESNSVFLRVERVAVAGDYNGDGMVNIADYTVWRDTLGQASGDLYADGDGSGVVDQADYDVWKSNFGLLIARFPSVVEVHTAIPEPSCMALIAGAMLLAYPCRHMLR